MARTKTRPESLHAQERRAFAVRLRQAWHTYRAIYAAARQQFGRALPPSYSPRRVHADVMHALQVQHAELAEHVQQVRTQELDRLDRLLLGIWDRATHGDTKAIHTVLAIMARRARYLPGLEGPLRIAPTNPTGAEVYTPALPSDEEQAAVVHSLAAYGQQLLMGQDGAGVSEPLLS